MGAETKSKAQKRLRRVAGQVEGIHDMVEQDRYCVDVLTQIAAARAALARVGQMVLRSHIETCVTDALQSGKAGDREQKLDELMEVFALYGQIQDR
jgi:DNA-binding FrmR family transcriptional regulator